MALKQLAAISITVVPQELAPPPAHLKRVEKPKPPQPRTQLTDTTVSMEPETRQRVNVKYHVTITPGNATSKPTQTRPDIIPDDTETHAPLTHPYEGKSGNIPLVHRYNTR